MFAAQGYVVACVNYHGSSSFGHAFLVLAQTDSGISCFLMPRWTPDGERNAFHIQRLKDKLGTRALATAEIEFEGALAYPIGDLVLLGGTGADRRPRHAWRTPRSPAARCERRHRADRDPRRPAGRRRGNA